MGAVEWLTVLVEPELDNARGDRRLERMIGVSEPVNNDALDCRDSNGLGHEQEDVRVVDIGQSRFDWELSEIVVLPNLTTQVLCAVLVKRQSSYLTSKPGSVVEKNREVGCEHVSLIIRNPREPLEVPNCAWYLRTGRCERHLEGGHHVHCAVIDRESTQQPLDALGEVRCWRHAQPVVKSSSRVGGVEA